MLVESERFIAGKYGFVEPWDPVEVEMMLSCTSCLGVDWFCNGS